MTIGLEKTPAQRRRYRMLLEELEKQKRKLEETPAPEPFTRESVQPMELKFTTTK
jgi:hypothetical protein